MPLQPLNTRPMIGHNAAQMLHGGDPQSRGIAMALANARHHPGGFANGGVTDDIGLVNPSVDQMAAVMPSSALTPVTPQQIPDYPVPQPQRKPQQRSLSRHVAQNKSNEPLYGGYGFGGMIPQHMDTGGTPATAPSGADTVMPPNPTFTPRPFSDFIANVPVGGTSGTPNSPYLASVNGQGIPSGQPGTPLSFPQTYTSPVPPAVGAQADANAAAAAAAQQQSNLFAGLVPTGSDNGLPSVSSNGLPFARGGQALASGGTPATPWFAKREATGEQFHGSGLFNAPSAGRTDVLNRTVPSGAYVLPADVVSGLGEGNTMAGSHVMDMMMHSLPYGMKGGKMGGGRGPPRAPAAYKAPAFNMNTVKRGGAPHGQGNVPVVVAGGEYLISPEHVAAIGGGDMKHGHKILDHFVVHIRKKTAKTLNKLPGPKK